MKLRRAIGQLAFKSARTELDIEEEVRGLISFELKEYEYRHIYAKRTIDRCTDGCDHQKGVNLVRVMLPYRVIGYLVRCSQDLELGVRIR
jgi:hypothetical protein